MARNAKWLLGACVVTVLAGGVVIAGHKEKTIKAEYVEKALASLDTCETYGEKSPYSRTIAYMAIGYAEDNTPCQAVVISSFSTYSKVTGILTVVKQDGKYLVEKADILDIERIKDGKKRNKAKAALKHIRGQVVRDEKKRQKKIDAMSGATRQANMIFSAFDRMAKAAVEEMEKNPKWKRKTLPKKEAEGKGDASKAGPAGGAKKGAKGAGGEKGGKGNGDKAPRQEG